MITTQKTLRVTPPKALQKPPSLDWYSLNLLTSQSLDNRLWGVIDLYTGHPILVDWLAKFINANAIPARDNMALAKALQEYAIHEIKYFRERPERFASPLRTLNWKIGDCDDKTIFLASSLRSFRIPVSLKLITFYFPKKPRKRHVLPFAFIDNQWFAIESVSDIPFGVDPEMLANKKGIKTKSKFIGDKENVAA